MVSTSILLLSFMCPYLIQGFNLLNDLVVICVHVLRSDILCLVLLQQQEAIAYGETFIENGLLVRIERGSEGRRVCHDGLSKEI